MKVVYRPGDPIAYRLYKHPRSPQTTFFFLILNSHHSYIFLLFLLYLGAYN